MINLLQRRKGTKCSPVYKFKIDAKKSEIIYLRLTNNPFNNAFPENFEQIFEKRKKEADEFYEMVTPPNCTDDQKNIQRQAFAGLLWSRQYYHYDLERWLNTSDGITPLTEEREKGRNSNWKYLKNQDVISMPDKWEYPW